MRVSLSAMFVLALGAAALAQGGAGTIAGRVTDFDGGAVRSASIEAKNTATAAVSKSAVSSQGDYTLAQLPPGTYDLSVTASNRFVTYVQKNVPVHAGRTERLDITLKYSTNLGTLGDDIGAVSNGMRANIVPTGPTPRMPDGKPDLSGLWLNVMTTRSPSVLAAAVLAGTCAAVPALAHHSFAAEFDIDKPITMAGTVTKIVWSNPHVYIFVDVKGDSGNVANWGFELGGPNSLLRLGWTRDALKAGDGLTVDGYRAKDGSNLANARVIRVPDGRKLFAGSSGDAGPAK